MGKGPMNEADRKNAYITAGIAGVVVFLFALGDKGMVAALLLGVLAAGLLGALLVWLGAPGAPSSALRPAPFTAPAVTPKPPVEEEPAPESSAADHLSAGNETAESTPAAQIAAVKPSKPLGGQAELSARKGDWRYEPGQDGAANQPLRAATLIKASKPLAGQAELAARKGSWRYRPAERQPRQMARPQGAADDLKQIKGIGPALESQLNTMGIWQFGQIAGWDASEIAWMDENLKGFHGRVSRDDWVGQARILAAGVEQVEESGAR